MKQVCQKCNAIVTKGNFCEACGCKMLTVCNCWILHKPYDCGHSNCPTGKEKVLFIMANAQDESSN